MRLSVLDQSLIRAGGNERTAFGETLELAQRVEELGYRRFWVSEHHDSSIIAGSSPEVLLAAIGARTRAIRIGSGGVMLPHYSAYKVAENFSVLANLYPGRVDLGVGRAPGADMAAAIALAADGRPKFERFPELVHTLCEALWNPAFRPHLSPAPPERIPLWILGTSADSAMLAAERGLPYAVALFINPAFDPRLIELYRKRFRPSMAQSEPQVMLAMNTLCSGHPDHAEAMARAADLTFIRFVKQRGRTEVCSPEEAATHVFSPDEEVFVRSVSGARAVGTPESVRQRIEEIAHTYKADEIMLVTNTYHFRDRLRSFELLAEAFGLTGSDG